MWSLSLSNLDPQDSAQLIVLVKETWPTKVVGCVNYVVVGIVVSSTLHLDPLHISALQTMHPLTHSPGEERPALHKGIL